MSVSIKISRQLAYGLGLGLGLGFIVTPGLVYRLIVLSAEIEVTFSTYFRHDTLLLCEACAGFITGVWKKNQQGEGEGLGGASNTKRGTCHYRYAFTYICHLTS